jgi:hypothetical protein
MASRRRFLEVSLGACAAAIRPISGQPRTVFYYKAVFDERFEEPCAFAAGAAARRIPTAPIRGDITSLFFDDLDRRWKRGPVLLAGYTTPASLFCLDLLARDRGMRVCHWETAPGVERALRALDAVPPHRSMLPSSGASPLVFWIIRPSGRA